MYALFRPRLLLVAITSTTRTPEVKLEMEKGLKLSLKQVKVPKKLTMLLCNSCQGGIFQKIENSRIHSKRNV